MKCKYNGYESHYILQTSFGSFFRSDFIIESGYMSCFPKLWISRLQENGNCIIEFILSNTPDFVVM